MGVYFVLGVSYLWVYVGSDWFDGVDLIFGSWYFIYGPDSDVSQVHGSIVNFADVNIKGYSKLDSYHMSPILMKMTPWTLIPLVLLVVFSVWVCLYCIISYEHP